MLKRILLVALAAGGLAGVLIAVVHAYTTVPIILHAEEYEHGEAQAAAAPAFASANGVPVLALALPDARALLARPAAPRPLLVSEGASDREWAPQNGIERTLYTLLADLLSSIGFAFLLVGCFALDRKPVDARRGVAWGLAGFAVFTLAPALGLAPEVPGTISADLADRQLWWLFAAAAAAAGLWLIAFGRAWWAAAIGVAVIALPHVVGAPAPEEIGGPVPPELAGHFAAASIVSNGILWAALGWFAGGLWHRTEAAAVPARAHGAG